MAFALCSRTTTPGVGLVWAAHPHGQGTAVAALRSSALARGAVAAMGAVAAQTGAATAQPPWREATVLEGWRADPRDLRALLEQIGGLPGRPLIRLEWPLPRAEELAALVPPRPRGPGNAIPPLVVHFTLDRAQAPDRNARQGIRQLADLGLPLCAEIYLEKGGVPAAAELGGLLLELVRHRIRPAWLVDGAWLPPERRLVRKISLQLVLGLRGWVSGLAVPQLVTEDQRGVRTPLVPGYLRAIRGDTAELANYRGERFFYSHASPPPQNR